MGRRGVALKGERVTRVEIERRGWERLGARGLRWCDINRAGWNGVLPAYRATAAGEA